MFPKENNNGSQIGKSLEKTRRPFTQSDRTKSVDFVCTFGHLHSYGFDDKWTTPAGVSCFLILRMWILSLEHFDKPPSPSMHISTKWMESKYIPLLLFFFLWTAGIDRSSMNVVVNVVQDFDIRLNMQIMRSYILLREQNKDNKSQKSKEKRKKKRIYYLGSRTKKKTSQEFWNSSAIFFTISLPSITSVNARCIYTC